MPIVSTELIQGSKEWLEWRAQGIGSSDIASILGTSPYKTAHRLWLEKAGKAQPEDLSDNFMVQRGSALEAEARDRMNLDFQTDYKPALFIHASKQFLRYSSDGYSAKDNSIIEIKCPGTKNHELAISGKIPEHYLTQVHYGLMVSGADFAYYVSYDPDHKTIMAVNKVYASDSEMIALEFAATSFWLKVTSLQPPPLTNKDKVDLNSNDFVANLCNRLIEIDKKTKVLEEEAEQIKSSLRAYADKEKICYGYCDGITFQKSIRKGSIKYSETPEIKELDLEKYRSEPKEVWTFKIG